MNKTVISSFAILLGASGAAWSDASPIGKWKTIDDKTGQPRSVVEFKDIDGELRGTVTDVFARPTDKPGFLCEKCEGELKNKPVIGMTIVRGLKKDGDEYVGGQILDPDEGKVYKCKLKVESDGNTLNVRGYIGAPVFGRTQTWVRIE